MFSRYVNVPHLTIFERGIGSRFSFFENNFFSFFGSLPAGSHWDGVRWKCRWSLVVCTCMYEGIFVASFNRFPIRGNLSFGPTPSFVLRPSLRLFGNVPKI